MKRMANQMREREKRNEGTCHGMSLKIKWNNTKKIQSNADEITTTTTKNKINTMLE